MVSLQSWRLYIRWSTMYVKFPVWDALNLSAMIVINWRMHIIKFILWPCIKWDKTENVIQPAVVHVFLLDLEHNLHHCMQQRQLQHIIFRVQTSSGSLRSERPLQHYCHRSSWAIPKYWDLKRDQAQTQSQWDERIYHKCDRHMPGTWIFCQNLMQVISNTKRRHKHFNILLINLTCDMDFVIKWTIYIWWSISVSDRNFLHKPSQKSARQKHQILSDSKRILQEDHHHFCWASLENPASDGKMYTYNMQKHPNTIIITPCFKICTK